jgi:hypothetical protein
MFAPQKIENYISVSTAKISSPPGVSAGTAANPASNGGSGGAK